MFAEIRIKREMYRRQYQRIPIFNENMIVYLVEGYNDNGDVVRRCSMYGDFDKLDTLIHEMESSA